MNTETKRKGFTLIELIVVIVIVAVLAAIVVPKFSGQVDKSKVSKTKGNLSILRTALETYNAEKGAYPNASLSDLITSGYLKAIPEEGVTPSTTVVNTSNGAGGWYYNTTTRDIVPNLNGNDYYGTAYSSY